MNIHNVVFDKNAQKSLARIPRHVVIKLYEWIEAVAHSGILEVRKISGFHDEPLKGKRKGQRSIRLSKSYRAIYIIRKNGQMELVEIIEVNKHDY